MSVDGTAILRITGSAAELDGFVRSFELHDDIVIASIRHHVNSSSQLDDSRSGAADQIVLDVHFGISPSADSAYDLVMDQFRNFQRAGIDMKIEQVGDPAGTPD